MLCVSILFHHSVSVCVLRLSCVCVLRLTFAIIYQSPFHSFHLPKSIPFISSTKVHPIHFIYQLVLLQLVVYLDYIRLLPLVIRVDNLLTGMGALSKGRLTGSIMIRIFSWCRFGIFLQEVFCFLF